MQKLCVSTGRHDEANPSNNPGKLHDPETALHCNCFFFSLEKDCQAFQKFSRIWCSGRKAARMAAERCRLAIWSCSKRLKVVKVPRISNGTFHIPCESWKCVHALPWNKLLMLHGILVKIWHATLANLDKYLDKPRLRYAGRHMGRTECHLEIIFLCATCLGPVNVNRFLIFHLQMPFSASCILMYPHLWTQLDFKSQRLPK